MKIITHISDDVNPTFLDPSDCWDSWIDNRCEPIVRCGGEVFQTHFEPETGWETFIADPRRSLVRPVFRSISERYDSTFEIDDFLIRLVLDLGIVVNDPNAALQVAFHTIFPFCVATRLSKSWRHIGCFNALRCNVIRVVNNPFFYTERTASEKRLLEIAEDAGCRYAVDLVNEIPSAEVLAREIALVNHIHEGDEAVAEAEARLLSDFRGCFC